MQVRVFDWKQGQTDDQLTPSRALLASPPIFEVASGGAQTVRLLARSSDRDKVVAYRLVLDELPTPDASGQVRLALRISLPVFVRPGFATSPDLRWRLQQAGRDSAEIVAVNQGTGPARVGSMSLNTTTHGTLQARGLSNPWVLPGTERHWTVPVPAGLDLRARSGLRLTALLQDGPINIPLTLAPQP